MIASIDALVDALGGPVATGLLVGVKRNSVEMWSTRGWVPPGHHLSLVLAACERGLTLDPALFEMPRGAFDVLYRLPPPPAAGLRPSRSRRRTGRAA